MKLAGILITSVSVLLLAYSVYRLRTNVEYWASREIKKSMKEARKRFGPAMAGELGERVYNPAVKQAMDKAAGIKFMLILASIGTILGIALIIIS